MTRVSSRFLYWTPRILCIAFAMFISIFALDVFAEGLPFWRTVLALAMHLIPTFLLIALLALAWKWEWIGAVGFAVLAVLYVVMSWGRFPISVYFVIAGPAFLLAVLFLVNWMLRKELHAAG